MGYFFSPSRLAFFHSDIPCDDAPNDLRPLTDERHEALMGELLRNGKQLAADDAGDPLAIERDA